MMQYNNAQPFFAQDAKQPAPVKNPLGEMMNRRTRSGIIGVVYTGVVSIASIVMMAWPDSWEINEPIAAFFGPVLVIHLGWGSWSYTPFFRDGLISLFIIVGFCLPFLFKRHWSTVALLILGALLWCVVGIKASHILRA